MTKYDVYYEGNLRTRCVHGDRPVEVMTDGPKTAFGKGELFSPTDLLAAALGTCVLTLIGIAANKHKIDVAGLRLNVEKVMDQGPTGPISRLVVHVYCPKTFPADVQQKLEIAGSKCPVHQSLHPDIKQDFFFHWGEA